jgi:hypothetical protein
MTERRKALPALAGPVLVLTAPVVSWFAIGNLSEQGHGELDYAVQPPRLAPGVELACGLTAQLTAVAALLVLVLGFVRRWVRPGWALVIAPLTLVGLAAGLVERVMTAGVIGANIGAGLAVMFFGPLSVLLVALAAWRCVVLRRPRPAPPGARPVHVAGPALPPHSGADRPEPG